MSIQKKIQSWLKKPRISDEGWRKKVEFLVKNISIAAGVLVFLYVGTDVLDRQAVQLGAKGVPAADTVWSNDVKIRNGTDGYCHVYGQYQIKNIGELAFSIDKVEILVTELSGAIFNEDSGVYIFSLDNQIQKGSVVVRNVIPVGETYSQNNLLQKSFGIAFNVPPEKRNQSYVVSAIATGGTPKSRSWFQSILDFIQVTDRKISEFGPNDLRIDTESFQFGPLQCVPLESMLSDDDGPFSIVAKMTKPEE